MIKPLFLLLSLLTSIASYASEPYLTHEEFLEKAFQTNTPTAKTLWLNAQQKSDAEKIMQHPLVLLRVRYWQYQNKSAWILNEIGKEKPITIGIIINDKKIESVDILAFRESRGWEVRYAFFTNQFKNSFLTNDIELNKRIDGVTGATLSVSAVKRCATLALYLAQSLTLYE
jgi:hypothetical protein